MLWKLFDMFIGAIQAFIFALLTVLYFGMAGAGHGDDHDEAHDEPRHDEDRTTRQPTCRLPHRAADQHRRTATRCTDTRRPPRCGTKERHG